MSCNWEVQELECHEDALVPDDPVIDVRTSIERLRLTLPLSLCVQLSTLEAARTCSDFSCNE